MEKNGESIDSLSVVKSKSVTSAGDFHCSSSDLRKAFLPEKHDSHERKYSCSSNTDDNNISNNNNVDDDNRDDIGCVHYKRRAKFVVRTHFYSPHVSHVSCISHSYFNSTNLSLLKYSIFTSLGDSFAYDMCIVLHIKFLLFAILLYLLEDIQYVRQRRTYGMNERERVQRLNYDRFSLFIFPFSHFCCIPSSISERQTIICSELPIKNQMSHDSVKMMLPINLISGNHRLRDSIDFKIVGKRKERSSMMCRF